MFGMDLEQEWTILNNKYTKYRYNMRYKSLFTMYRIKLLSSVDSNFINYSYVHELRNEVELKMIEHVCHGTSTLRRGYRGLGDLGMEGTYSPCKKKGRGRGKIRG